MAIKVLFFSLSDVPLLTRIMTSFCFVRTMQSERSQLFLLDELLSTLILQSRQLMTVSSQCFSFFKVCILLLVRKHLQLSQRPQLPIWHGLLAIDLVRICLCNLKTTDAGIFIGLDALLNKSNKFWLFLLLCNLYFRFTGCLFQSLKTWFKILSHCFCALNYSLSWNFMMSQMTFIVVTWALFLIADQEVPWKHLLPFCGWPTAL